MQPESDSIRQWYLVVVLATLSALGTINRGALNLIVNPIRDDLHITDVQMSLLLGFSFVMLYSMLSIPAGYLADFVNRRLLLSGAVLFWSVMSAMCGFAGGYWQLFAGRMGVGIGEAVLPPAGYSLIRDGVSTGNRGRAYGIYHTGTVLGGGAGALIGGSLYVLAKSGGLRGIPIVGQLKPWQAVIAVPGLIGILFSLLLLTVREPPRLAPTSRADAPTFGELFRYMRKNWRIYGPVFAAGILTSLAGDGWNAWIAAALGRIWDLSPGVIGKNAGLLNLVLTPLPAFVFGYLMDYFKRRGHADGPLRVAVVGCLLNIGPTIFILLAPSVTAMWISYGLSLFFSTFSIGLACSVTFANLTPSRLMGKVTSLYFLSAFLLGGATGPTIFAAVSQYGFDGPRAIANSLMLCYAIFMTIITGLLYVAARQVQHWYRIEDEKPAHLRHAD